MRSTEEARKLRKGKCAYNPWTHKELIYLLQKFISPRSKVLLRMLLGEGLVGVNHRAIPTATQRKTINKYFMLRLRYIMVHHMCMLRESQTFNTSIPQIHNYSTSMTLILPPSYLKTIIKYQTSHSIQCTSMKVFILKQISMLF